MTYAETKYFCNSLGLYLCDRSCEGQGCGYDQFPVWTGLPCPNKPLPPPLPSPPAPPPSPPSPPSHPPLAIPESGIAIVHGAYYNAYTLEGLIRCVWPGDENVVSVKRDEVSAHTHGASKKHAC